MAEQYSRCNECGYPVKLDGIPSGYMDSAGGIYHFKCKPKEQGELARSVKEYEGMVYG